MGQIDKAFACFFESIGYGVTFEGRFDTGARWHEIYDDDGIIVQVAFGTPLEEFLADLPHLAEGRSGIGPTNYWCACEDDDKLRALHARVTSTQARKLRTKELAECAASLVGRDVTLVHQVYSSRHSMMFEAGEMGIVRSACDELFDLNHVGGSWGPARPRDVRDSSAVSRPHPSLRTPGAAVNVLNVRVEDLTEVPTGLWTSTYDRIDAPRLAGSLWHIEEDGQIWMMCDVAQPRPSPTTDPTSTTARRSR